MPQKIIATILAGGHREALIGDAIDSVIDWADEVLLVDTGPSAEVACRQEFARNPAKVRTVRYPFGTFDCATARNFAVDTAKSRGADWIVMLDTDERINANGVDIRAALEVAEAEAVKVWNDRGEYPKVRFIRGDSLGSYEDPVHEDFRGVETVVDMLRVTFTEIPKSREEQDASVARVEAIARDWVAREPRSPRAWMHLGSALIYRNAYADACTAFRRVDAHSDNPEERAWALFRAGECETELDDLESAAHCAVDALLLAPYLPEPAFLAAFAYVKLGDWLRAAAWADIAIALGKTASVPRITPSSGGFRVGAAWWEGPWLMRAHACDGLGLTELRDHALAMHEKAAAARGEPLTDEAKAALREGLTA